MAVCDQAHAPALLLSGEQPLELNGYMNGLALELFYMLWQRRKLLNLWLSDYGYLAHS